MSDGLKGVNTRNRNVGVTVLILEQFLSVKYLFLVRDLHQCMTDSRHAVN